jgi:hypothetical protein
MFDKGDVRPQRRHCKNVAHYFTSLGRDHYREDSLKYLNTSGGYVEE